jgi:hypothetical protein
MYGHTSARFFVTYLGREGRRPKQNEIVRFGSLVTSDLCCLCHQGSWSVSVALLSIGPFTAENEVQNLSILRHTDRMFDRAIGYP